MSHSLRVMMMVASRLQTKVVVVINLLLVMAVLTGEVKWNQKAPARMILKSEVLRKLKVYRLEPSLAVSYALRYTQVGHFRHLLPSALQVLVMKEQEEQEQIVSFEFGFVGVGV